MSSKREYSTILVARHSPANGCHASDGEVLVSAPMPRETPKPDSPWHFVSLGPSQAESRYGWTQKVPPFTVAEFIEQHAITVGIEHEQLERLFEDIEKLESRVPVAVDCVPRGIPPVATLKVHRVVFYDEAAT